MTYIQFLKILRIPTIFLTLFIIFNFQNYGFWGTIGLALSVSLLASLAWIVGYEEGLKEKGEAY